MYVCCVVCVCSMHYIRMCVCACVRMFICVHVCVRRRVCAYLCICVGIYVRANLIL